MRRSLLSTLVAGSIGLFMASQASAVTVFSSDFEAPTFTAGAIPDTSTQQVYVQFDGWGTNKFPDMGTGIIGKPASGPQWIHGGYDSNPADLGDAWQNDGYVTADPTNAANQVAAFVGSSSQGPINASGAAVIVNLNTTDSVTLSMQMYYPSARNGTGTPVAVMGFMNQGLSFGGSHYFSGQSDGTVAFSFNGHDAVVTPDAWHTAVLTINPAASTADFSVDGVSVVSGLAVNLGGFTGLAKFNTYMDDPNWYWGNNGGNGAILIDNVAITQVPEPVTMALLALGGLLVARRRHA